MLLVGVTREADTVAGANKRGADVLVVEDDPTILEIVREALQSEGYGVATATNGRQALEVLEDRAISLVVLDMRMPVLDGWGFAREATKRGFRVPIIVMTAAENAKRWAEEIGAAGYVAKPFELGTLIRVVERNRR